MKKHIPQRICTGCRQTGSKRELQRIVRTAEGRVVADPTGKQAGRGAYVHRARECWDAVLNERGRLEHALNMETPLSDQDRATLTEIGAAMPRRSARSADETTPVVR